MSKGAWKNKENLKKFTLNIEKDSITEIEKITDNVSKFIRSAVKEKLKKVKK